jgi:hypothetical protein
MPRVLRISMDGTIMALSYTINVILLLCQCGYPLLCSLASWLFGSLVVQDNNPSERPKRENKSCRAVTNSRRALLRLGKACIFLFRRVKSVVRAMSLITSSWYCRDHSIKLVTPLQGCFNEFLTGRLSMRIRILFFFMKKTC